MSESSKQLIIAISREFGSGGHVIAEDIADRFGLDLYDYRILQEIAAEKGMDIEELKRFDEKPFSRLIHRNINGYTNSVQDNIAQIEFDFMRAKASSGESFVIVGRCSDELLSDFSSMISIFVRADEDSKLEKIMRTCNVNIEQARELQKKEDNHRRTYHNYYCSYKWGDSRHYDMCINSSVAGYKGTADIIEEFVRKRR